MKTNPRGRCFLVFHPSRADEAATLIHALHDAGIPTVPDLDRVADEPSDESLRRAIDDPFISAAILWITPEVEHSAAIRRILAPGFLARARNDDGFHIIPACAGGITRTRAASMLTESRESLDNVAGWKHLSQAVTLQRNYLMPWRAATDPRLAASMAARIAARALSLRLEAINTHTPDDEPLLLRATNRTPPPKTLDAALVFDWRHRFDGRLATPGAWNAHLLPALATAANHLEHLTPTRRIRCEASLPQSAAGALGFHLHLPGDPRTSWRQQTTDAGAFEEWTVAATQREFDLTTTELLYATPGARDLAILASLNANATRGFLLPRPEVGESSPKRRSDNDSALPDHAESGASLEVIAERPQLAPHPSLPAFRAILHIHTPDHAAAPVQTPGQSLHAAKFIADTITAARTQHRPTTTHLFLAAPPPVSFLVGQLLDPAHPVQTYELSPADDENRFTAAAFLRAVPSTTPA